MKNILVLLILFSLIALPALGELTFDCINHCFTEKATQNLTDTTAPQKAVDQ